MCGLGGVGDLGGMVGLSAGVTLHPELGVVNYRVRELGGNPDGQVGTTVGVMRDRAVEDAQDPGFRQWAGMVTGNGSERDKVESAFWHAKRGIRFQQDKDTGAGVGDVPGDQVVEVIVRPVDMMGYVQQGVAVGDCDDFSMYVAALLESQGIPCAFVTVAADGRDPGQYSHVYCVAYPGGERVAVDASHGGWPGWEVPNEFGKYREWPVGGGGDGPGLLGMVAASMAGMWLYEKVTRG